MSHTFNSARCYELFCQLFSRSLFHAILNQKRQLTCELYRERHESFGRGNEMGSGFCVRGKKISCRSRTVIKANIMFYSN